MDSNIEPSPLRLAAVYQSSQRLNMTSCAFSSCGKYFAFVEAPRIAAVYLFEQLSNVCFPERRQSSDTPDSSELSGKYTPWRALPTDFAAEDSTPVPLTPFCRINTDGAIHCITFTTGDVTRCRLPHRIHKRISPVVQGSSVSLMLLSLANGYTMVYNISDFKPNLPAIQSMVLFAEQLPIFKVTASPDGSLRVATVHLNGYVSLWDLWDDGNMYASLKNNFLLPATSDWSRYASRGEACTFAWQPFGTHICLAGQRGHGVILQSESPFQVLAVLRPGHVHRVSDVSYTHDGSLLVTVSYDSSSIVWSVPEYEPLHRYWHMGHAPSMPLLGGANGHHLYGLAVAPDDLGFVTICEDRCVRLWPLVPTNSPTKTFTELGFGQMGGTKLRSVAFSPCGRVILVSLSNNRLLVFTTQSELLSLSVQCIRVIRRRLLLRMRGMKSATTLTARPPPGVSNITPSALCLLASLLPVPSKLLPIILGELLWSFHINQKSAAS